MSINSLASKLSLAFIGVVVLAVASVSLLARQETNTGFESYLEARGSNYLGRVADSLAQLYQRDGHWRDAQSVLSSLLRNPSDRLVLVDATGTVVADSSSLLVGGSAAKLDAVNSSQIMVGAKQVATVYLVSFTPGGPSMGRGGGPSGNGAMGRGSAAGGNAQPMMSSLESTYLASIDRAIFTGAILAGLFAIVVGLLVARKITRPLAELNRGAREVASGRLDHRIPISSSDELGRVAAMFNKMAEGLEQNELARRLMVADIAHDLRTPLTVIEGTVDGILDGVFEPDRDNLESIKEEVALLTKLVADLRTLSLAEAGQLRLEKHPTDLLEFAERFLAKVEPIAQKKGITCRVEGSEPGPVVLIDVERMGQVVGNLLDNAIRHTPAGGTITVRVDREPQGKLPGSVAISVADSGEGVPAESLPFIFDRFYRADQSRTRKSGGSGLGLAIVKQLVEAHGGRVWAESQPGKGSLFVVELPAVTS